MLDLKNRMNIYYKALVIILLFLSGVMCTNSTNAELFYNNLISLNDINNNIIDALGYVNGDFALKGYYGSIINNIEQGTVWINPKIEINFFKLKKERKLFISPIYTKKEDYFIMDEDVVSNANLSFSYGYNYIYSDRLTIGITGINSFLATGSNELVLTTRVYNFGIGTYLRYYINNDKTLYSNIVLSYIRSNNEITYDSESSYFDMKIYYKTNNFDIHTDVRYDLLSNENVRLTLITDLNKIFIYDSTNKRTVDSLYLVPGIEVSLFNNSLGFRLDYRALIDTNVKYGFPGIYNILDLTNRFDFSVNLGFNIGKHFNIYYSFKYPFSKYHIINNHSLGFNIRF